MPASCPRITPSNQYQQLGSMRKVDSSTYCISIDTERGWPMCRGKPRSFSAGGAVSDVLWRPSREPTSRFRVVFPTQGREICAAMLICSAGASAPQLHRGVIHNSERLSDHRHRAAQWAPLGRGGLMRNAKGIQATAGSLSAGSQTPAGKSGQASSECQYRAMAVRSASRNTSSPYSPTSSSSTER